MGDPFNLQRFVKAQDPGFDDILSELRQGYKTGHWMWFVFPQLKGLGSSANADYYGISSRAEAEAYLRHPTLGPRLREATALVNRVEGHSIESIFGGIDALKFRSSMTLFAEAAPDESVFREALTKYFEGEPDRRTLEMLARAANAP